MRSWKELAAEAVRVTGVPYPDLHKGKTIPHRVPRYALFKALGLRGASDAQIGRWFGFDHSTVLNARRRADELLDKDPQFRKTVEHLMYYGIN